MIYVVKYIYYLDYTPISYTINFYGNRRPRRELFEFRRNKSKYQKRLYSKLKKFCIYNCLIIIASKQDLYQSNRELIENSTLLPPGKQLSLTDY